MRIGKLRREALDRIKFALVVGEKGVRHHT